MSNQQDQMAADIHTIATPFRFVGGMLRTALMIIVVPLLLVGGAVYFLVTGNSPMSQDELGMVTAFCRLALLLSLVWLPFMFIGSHVRKLGYCALGSLGLFLFFMTAPRPDHAEFVLSFGQLATMVLLPIAVMVPFYIPVPNWSKQEMETQGFSSPQVFAAIKNHFVQEGKLSADADEATTLKMWRKDVKSTPVMD